MLLYAIPRCIGNILLIALYQNISLQKKQIKCITIREYNKVNLLPIIDNNSNIYIGDNKDFNKYYYSAYSNSAYNNKD